MKIVILCGGQGTRIRDISEVLPKPMLPIGGKPILWHIMKIYAQYGYKDFVLCLGYKGWVVKEFFLNYYAKTSDFSLTLGQKDSLVFHNNGHDADWRVTFADTGEHTQTGARIARAFNYFQDDDFFSVTYGDGVAAINIDQLIETHKKAGLSATVTGVHPLGRFGEIEVEGNHICEFNEKPNLSTGMINGGFMIFNKDVVGKYFHDDMNLSLEQDVIPQLVKDRQVGIYKHEGPWRCVDTPREYHVLNQLWAEDKAFWKTCKEETPTGKIAAF